MGWIRLDDSFYDDNKIIDAGPHAMALWVVSLAYCNRNLTDGFVPRRKAEQLLNWDGCSVDLGGGDLVGFGSDDCARYAISNALAFGLWHEDDHDCPDCAQPGPLDYVVHNYLKYQPSRDEIDTKAQANRDRVAAWKQRQAAKPSKKRQIKPPKPANALTNAPVTDYYDVNNAMVQTPQPQPQGNYVTTPTEVVTSLPASARAAQNRAPNGAVSPSRTPPRDDDDAPLARLRGIAACGLCDDDGYGPGRLLCDHVDRTETRRNGMAAVRAALAKPAAAALEEDPWKR